MSTSTETFKVCLAGVAPLLMRSSRLIDPLDPATIALARLTRKRMKTSADHSAIAKAEWFGGLWLTGGVPAVPPSALEACLVRAAKLRKAGAVARAAVSVVHMSPLKYDGPSDLDGLYEDKRFILRRAVKVRGASLMRTRAHFPDWSFVAEISYLATQISRRDLIDDLVVAGDLVGLGDWRPQFGRFRVKLV